MGEGENDRLRLDFDTRLRLEFKGARVTTDAGLPLFPRKKNQEG